jgi:hypothetical protein
LLFVGRSHLAKLTLYSCGKGDLIQTLPKNETCEHHHTAGSLNSECMLLHKLFSLSSFLEQPVS